MGDSDSVGLELTVLMGLVCLIWCLWEMVLGVICFWGVGMVGCDLCEFVFGGLCISM